MSMFNLHILLKRAENEILKPMGTNHTQLMHAMSQPLVEAISSSIPKGKIADPIIRVPKQTMARNSGCDALTDRSLR